MKKQIDFSDFINNRKYVSKSERKEIDFQVKLIGKIIEAREKKGISQRKLACLSKVKQPEIARIERMKCSPQIDTIFRLLNPLGYTLSITKLK